MSSVTVKNCISFYQTAEEISAKTLMTHCSQLISNHWVSKTASLYDTDTTVTRVCRNTAQSVVRWTLTSNGCGFEPHCGQKLSLKILM